METKIAVLRGINVGGKRRVLMADLKHLFHTIGVLNISTYIQSGNIIFKSDIQNTVLAKQIKLAMQNTFGFNVPVIVITRSTLVLLKTLNPFLTSITDNNQLHLTFLENTPSPKSVSQLTPPLHCEDDFVIVDDFVFICCKGKYHKSKLSNAFFEKKLLVNATTRNWKTVLKLIDLTN